MLVFDLSQERITGTTENFLTRILFYIKMKKSEIKWKERLSFMWAFNSIFYQIYPIGFCGAPVHNDGVCEPRIRKLMDWSGYLENLGVDSILLNPVFESDNHGYDTRDFKKIDCRLVRTRISPRSARIFTATMSKSYSTEFLTM